jgi:hypothetical protein
MDAIQAGVCEVIHKNKEFRDLKYMRIDGSTPAKQREANVNQFQQDDHCRVGGARLSGLLQRNMNYSSSHCVGRWQ